MKLEGKTAPRDHEIWTDGEEKENTRDKKVVGQWIVGPNDFNGLLELAYQR